MISRRNLNISKRLLKQNPMILSPIILAEILLILHLNQISPIFFRNVISIQHLTEWRDDGWKETLNKFDKPK